MKQKARWGVCASGLTKGEHEWRDHCWTCAPFWYDVPYCPICGKKLTEKGYCKNCRKHFDLEKEAQDGQR